MVREREESSFDGNDAVRWALVSMVGGFLIPVIPALVVGIENVPNFYPNSLMFAAVADGYLFFSSAIPLFLFGLMIGWRVPRRYAYVGGMTMLLFLVIVAVDTVLHPEAHFLIFLEIVMYLVMSLPAGVGTLVGNISRRRSQKNRL